MHVHFLHVVQHLKALVSHRRHWGIPIPALQCRKCGHDQLDGDIVAAVSNGVEKGGIDFWEQVPLEELFTSTGLNCRSCGNKDPSVLGPSYEQLVDVLS